MFAPENEIARACDTVNVRGMVDAKHRGHGRPVSTVKRLMMQKRASAHLGHRPIRPHSLVWMHHRGKGLVCMSRKLNAFDTMSARSIRQCCHTKDKLAFCKGLADVERNISPQWSANVDSVLSHIPAALPQLRYTTRQYGRN